MAAGVSAQSGEGTWTRLPSSPEATNRFDDVHFVSPTTGFVIHGGGGQRGVHATTDGGATWETYNSLPVSPRSLGFVSDSVGWVGTLFGQSGQQLFETRDGGRTFANVLDRIVGGPMLGVCGFSVVSPQVVYAAGWCCDDGAGVMKTADGGESWHVTRLDSLAGFLIDVHFFDAQRGLATGSRSGLGGPAVVLGTLDGGATWTTRHVSSGMAEWGWKFSFPTPDTGYVSIERGPSGADGKVLRTTDGGMTWTDVVIPGGGSLQSVGFATPSVGWTSGRGVRSVTEDGGQSWTRYEGHLDVQVNRFRFLGDSLGYAVGRFVYRYERGGGTSVGPAPRPAPPVVTVAPNPASHRVAFVFDLATASHARLEVYDLHGRRLAVVTDQTFHAGAHTLTWSGAGDGPIRHPTGTYIYRLTTSEGSSSGPFLWIRN